ncbi:hypothetical protein D3C73_1129080 [compost metagenome]
MFAQTVGGVFFRSAQAAERLDGDQAFDAITDRCGEAGDAGTHRMAHQGEPVPAQRVGDIEHMGDRRRRGVHRTSGQMCAVAVSGQVDRHQIQLWQMRRQRYEAGRVVEPAVQGQHARSVARTAQAGNADACDLQFKRLQGHASEATASRANARACSGSALRQGM